MPVRRSAGKYRLSGQSIRSLEEFYDEIERLFKLPDGFGRNLDALWDLLTTDIKGPLELIWEASAVSKKSMGKDFSRVSALLREIGEQREDFTVSFR
ncbi:MAG: barstar family protein [Deltaproteobacteria bacterium]|nr:barstar family protein [Deltaproteobacteria bacterium]